MDEIPPTPPTAWERVRLQVCGSDPIHVSSSESFVFVTKYITTPVTIVKIAEVTIEHPVSCCKTFPWFSQKDPVWSIGGCGGGASGSLDDSVRSGTRGRKAEVFLFFNPQKFSFNLTKEIFSYRKPSSCLNTGRINENIRIKEKDLLPGYVINNVCFEIHRFLTQERYTVVSADVISGLVFLPKV